MALFFKISNGKYFTVEIRHDSEIYSLSEADTIKKILDTAKKIKRIHTKFIDTKGKIIGQNRIDYVATLDELFTYMLSLRVKYSRNPKLDPILDENEHYMVPLTIKQFTIEAWGCFNRDDFIEINKFDFIFNNNVLVPIKEILIRLKNVQTDNITLDDLKEIYQIIDKIFYNILVIRYSVEYFSL